MKKDDLLINLKQCLNTEESAVTVYAKHLSAIVLRSGLKKNEITEIKNDINILINSNKRHKKILEVLIEKVKRQKQDVF